MVERIFDRRGRRNWDDEHRENEDRRLHDRRKSDRRRGDRRKEQRRKKDLWAGDPSKTDRRVEDRRKGERRHGDRRDHRALPATIREIVAVGNGAVHSLPIHATVEEAIAIMAAHRIGLVAVLSDDKKLTGVFSERDVVRAFSDRGTEVMGHPIEPYVTRGVWQCAPGDSPYDVILTMSRNRMRHMPVMDGNKLVGMISTTDLLQFLAGDRAEQAGA